MRLDRACLRPLVLDTVNRWYAIVVAGIAEDADQWRGCVVVELGATAIIMLLPAPRRPLPHID